MFNQLFATKRRIVIAAIISLFVLICIVGIATTVSRRGKLPVVVSVVPSSARILLDGEKVSNGTRYLEPGSYVASIDHSGFASQTRTVIVTEKKKQNIIAVSLTPQSSEAKKWADDHRSAYKDNELYGGIEAQQNGQYIRTRFPIVEKLPYTDPYYKIAYRLNGDELVLTVDTESPRYRYFAVQKIRELGFNPTDYAIDFKQFHNPLEARS